jgi:hypothetical protein
MRRFAFLLCAALLAGCAETQDQPETTETTDTTAAAGMAPAGITLADVSGTWNVRVMPENADTVITSYTLNATDSTWTINFPNREPIPVQILAVEGDSIVTSAGPFLSAVRSNVMVTTESVNRLQNDQLVSRTVAHYAVTTPDSVAVLRTEGTRAQ